MSQHRSLKCASRWARADPYQQNLKHQVRSQTKVARNADPQCWWKSQTHLSCKPKCRANRGLNGVSGGAALTQTLTLGYSLAVTSTAYLVSGVCCPSIFHPATLCLPAVDTGVLPHLHSKPLLVRNRIQERLDRKAGNGAAPKVQILERGFNGFYQVRVWLLMITCATCRTPFIDINQGKAFSVPSPAAAVH